MNKVLKVISLGKRPRCYHKLERKNSVLRLRPFDLYSFEAEFDIMQVKTANDIRQWMD